MIKGRRDRKIVASIALLVVLSLLLVHMPGNGATAQAKGSGSAAVSPLSLSAVSSLGGTTSYNSSTYNGNIGVDLIFNFTNQAGLTSLLNNLSNPASPQYGQFLTASQFNSLFAPSQSTYSMAKSYFREYGINVKETFANRLLLSLSGSGANFSKAFHTSIDGYGTGAAQFFAPAVAPMLPAWLSSSINTVIGLNSQYADASLGLNIAGLQPFAPSNASFGNHASSAFNYPQVQVRDGIQYLAGSQFQPAYNETPLLNSVSPSQEVIATLLWGGSYTSGGKTVYTGAFNPSDVYTYFNKTLAQGELTPRIYGVPVGNAVAPGTSAQNDTSGAVVENTLDLEMTGSMAPGASIYNVYGQNSTLQDVTTAFNEILSPPAQYQALLNVSVITNSWGSNDTVVTQWNQFLQECQARGITVLASTGDSGNDFNSAKSVSNTEYVQFPSTAAYNSYGVVAVGGTNISLNINNQFASNYLSIASQQVWYEPGPQYSSATLGSAGGISKLYTEPLWQLDSQANSVIKGAGRGVPDIAAVANNTIIYFSNTTAANYYVVSGTSISSPVMAGLVAEMDAYRTHDGMSWLGFLNPNIYMLGTQQYGNTSTKPYLTPYMDVTVGHNMVYSALPGYDLVTGMGSINGYNFVTDLSQKTYNVSFSETGLAPQTTWHALVNGVEYNSTGTYMNLSLINGTYGFQILNSGNRVAVPTGGTITVSGSGVQVNLTFVTGYRVTFAEGSLPTGTPWYLLSWNYTQQTFSNQMSMLFPNGTFNYTVKSGDPNYYGSTGNFTVNGTPIIVNVNFTRGIFNVTFLETGLPTGQKWAVKTGNATEYSSNTTIRFTLPGGEYTFSVPAAGNYIGNYTSITMNTEGMNKTLYINFGYGYFVTFNLSGLPSGYHWNLLILTYNETSSNSTITVELQNGTYSYHAYYLNGQDTVQFNGNITVDGHNGTVNLRAAPKPFDYSYYLLYGGLFVVGLAVLGIGLMLLRKK